jgi:chromosome segregation ATPase
LTDDEFAKDGDSLTGTRLGLREQLEQANGRAAVAEARADFADQAFAACHAEGEELRERVDELTAKLAAAQDQAEAASSRAAAAVEAEQVLRQADAIRRARPLWQRLKAAWLAE